MFCFHLATMIQTCTYLYSSKSTLHNGSKQESISKILIGNRFHVKLRFALGRDEAVAREMYRMN